MQNLRRIHLWLPELHSTKGGIQTYSAFLLRAVRELYPGAECSVFLKHDTAQQIVRDDRPGNPVRYYCAGGLPPQYRTPGFAAQLVGRGLWGRPDLVISSHLNFGPAARRLKALAGTPYWLAAHGVEAWDVERPSLRAALRGADRILAVSGYTRERLLAEQRLDPSRVVILPNTFEAGRFMPGPKPPHLLERYGLKPGQPVILTVSRLVTSEQYKGYEKVIRALPAIRRAVPDVRYILVGKGDDRPRIEQLVEEMGVRDSVTLAGFVPDEELCAHYNLCDVFAMPSKREGFGIVFLEAMGCGKPTLAGNKDGSVDALRGGELGALVDPDDVREVADTLTAILRGVYPHALMYRPEPLRRRMLDLYGFDRFKRNLSGLIEASFTPGRPARWGTLAPDESAHLPTSQE